MLRHIETWVARLARRKALTVLLIGLTPMLVRTLLLPWMPMPAPRIHDEFSHLLLADTLAHGRLVNPVHPLWPHFDSMHMLVRPVYASIYPPAHGAMMALGQALTGNPWWGVCLSVGVMCAGICWMLQGWVTPGWALLGGVLAAARFGVSSYWMNSYYGGAMGALGGAMLLGALPRMLKRRRWQDAVVLALGLVVLANSRPYEGLVFSLPAIVLLAWKLQGRLLARPVAVPIVVVMGAAAAAMGYYYAAFSGNPFRMPYALFRATFTEAPHFLFQAPRKPPVYLHRETRAYYATWEMGSYRDARANRSPYGLMDKLKSFSRFYVGPVLWIPLAFVLLGWKRARVRFLLLTAAVLSAALAVEVWHAPHYAGPGLGLLILLVIEGLRQMRLTAWGAALVRVVCAVSLLMPVLHGGTRVGDGRERHAIVQRLLAAGERHLIVVRYQFGHNPGDEWVYNRADIDQSPIVWAREMDPTGNRKLLDYFGGRRVWLLEPDAAPARLSPYDPSALPDLPFGFVPLGTEGIDVLRSAEDVKEKILSRVPVEVTSFSCDMWNRVFTDVTGILPPDPAQGCFPAGARAQPIAFAPWFAWLQSQQ